LPFHQLAFIFDDCQETLNVGIRAIQRQSSDFCSYAHCLRDIVLGWTLLQAVAFATSNTPCMMLAVGCNVAVSLTLVASGGLRYIGFHPIPQKSDANEIWEGFQVAILGLGLLPSTNFIIRRAFSACISNWMSYSVSSVDTPNMMPFW